MLKTFKTGMKLGTIGYVAWRTFDNLEGLNNLAGYIYGQGMAKFADGYIQAIKNAGLADTSPKTAEVLKMLEKVRDTYRNSDINKCHLF